MTETRISHVRTVALECPQCHGDVSGFDIDKVFFCRQCSLGVDYFKNPPHICPVTFAAMPASSSDPVIWLPVWQFDVRVEILAQNAAQVVEAQKCSPECVWVFAFLINRMHLYGNPHVEFTRSRPVLSFGHDKRYLVGAQLGQEDAESFLQPVLLSIIDRDVDVTGLDVRVEIKQCHLRGLPAVLNMKTLDFISLDCSINRSSIIMNAWLEKIEKGVPIGLES